jgi:hypothetical protein
VHQGRGAKAGAPLAATPAGVEFQVNTRTHYEHEAPAVALDADGDFVAVRESGASAGSDIDGSSIQERRYDAQECHRMKLSRARALAVSGLALSIAAAADGVLAEPPRDAPGAHSAQVADPATQRHEVVLRSWQDREKIDGRDQSLRVEIVFDYRSSITRRLVYDAQSRLISDEVLAEQPRATPAEIEKAFDTVRRDPELGQLARSINATLDGGFLLREAAGKPCGPGTRCVQVFMLTEPDGERPRCSVVDLNERGRIAHRNYDPDATD